MFAYRLYEVAQDGRICAPAIIINADNDNAAIEQAQHFRGYHAVELWKGTECLIRIEAMSNDRL